MNAPSVSFRRASAAGVKGLIADCLAAAGAPRPDAEAVAGLMTEADLTGADAHGVFRLPQYVRRLRAGGFNRTPSIAVERTAPATARVDGDNGIGHLVVKRAAETAIEIARETGVAWVGVRGSNHAGSAGLYAEMAAAHGMIGIYSAVASANHMAVWGGNELLLGTNPLAIAVPTGTGPMVLDMATTVVSYGTIKKHVLQGLPMPEGWLIDRDTGEPITDPAKAGRGILLPIGGYKGSGLSLMLGVLAGILNGAAFGRDCVDFNADDTSVTDTGQLVIAVDVARFVGLDRFTAEVDRHMAALRGSARMAGVDAIRLPGDRRRECRAERAASGIPLPAALVAQLDTVATELGVKTLGER
ncbi:Ldh family oxidoreductase [Rhodoplanes sp. TEM]|uniref:Ldh family oxidoreductase n=1 Tax=Rhodoplanes tepidamans TaxID=200616 RepID=A0ABT5JBE7_RHOTP|nr:MULTISPECIES: Ldh family oxidoreductase [Rhodoplanes]MDC7786878.1 Ldh family oxidoreductase [Rhodoplanes tepidamans]MDC7984193.1 Ldh family oxidoreductase [Rhodoplanes sp. TEM]MDQ0356006.1 LDH2 family malate/lactate/ureidoglycolate dehydrogenase [Rhodoplanes tepidamans]